MVDSGREMHGSVRVGGKNSKNVWWNDEVVLGARDKVTNEKGRET